MCCGKLNVGQPNVVVLFYCTGKPSRNSSVGSVFQTLIDDLNGFMAIPSYIVGISKQNPQEIRPINQAVFEETMHCGARHVLCYVP